MPVFSVYVWVCMFRYDHFMTPPLPTSASPTRFISRLYRVCGVVGCDRSWHAGQHLCHLGPAQHALLADPAHGSHGPTRRHVETAGLSGLCSQQGESETPTKTALTHAHSFCFLSALHMNIVLNLKTDLHWFIFWFSYLFTYIFTYLLTYLCSYLFI